MKELLKRIVALIMLGCLAILCFACNSNTSGELASDKTETSETVKVDERINSDQAVIEQNMGKLQKYLDAEYLDADDLIAMEKECPDVNYGGFIGQYRSQAENSDENLHLRLAGDYNSYKVSTEYISLGILDIKLSEEQPVKVAR